VNDSHDYDNDNGDQEGILGDILASIFFKKLRG